MTAPTVGSASGLPVAQGVPASASIEDLESHPVPNPADLDETVGYCAYERSVDADAAVQLAEAAFPAWAALGAVGRAVLLRQAAVRLREANPENLARLLTREHGKPLWESRLDVDGAASVLEYYAGLAQKYELPTTIDTAVGVATVVRRPLGVTAVIVPWNYPVYLASLMLVPALLAGNTVVVKPSELAPLTVTKVLECLAEVLPPGVVCVVQGRGSEVGARLAEHPAVRGLFFTGSTQTGKAIARNGAGNLKRLGLELGGNDPAILLDGISLDNATLAELVRGVFTSSGQVCYSIKRIYVPVALRRQFIDRFLEACDELLVGNGLDPAVDMGPVSNQAQFEAVTELTDAARRSGAHVTSVGRKADPSGWDRGLFLLPTVVTDVDPQHPLVVREQFGPVVPIVAYDDIEQALSMANGTEHGLAASVWSADPDEALAVAPRIDAGSVFVNGHRVGCSALSVPFGGTKQSGVGRRHGFEALDESSELQAVINVANRAALPGPGMRARHV